ncbi:unnamed protein product [Pleuronectes platessa]|uniref:Uncharacterized protein n=1 Tax=Pleuronectes platessa TaxID=8262 RepID=A0A9N7YWH1_PLEPL|nr:unnamed protein product [Pleuronectes platessa]
MYRSHHEARLFVHKWQLNVKDECELVIYYCTFNKEFVRGSPRPNGVSLWQPLYTKMADRQQSLLRRTGETTGDSTGDPCVSSHRPASGDTQPVPHPAQEPSGEEGTWEERDEGTKVPGNVLMSVYTQLMITYQSSWQILSVVLFTVYSVGHVSETTLELKNLTSSSRHIRVNPPTTPYFSIGLDVNFTSFTSCASDLRTLSR